MPDTSSKPPGSKPPGSKPTGFWGGARQGAMIAAGIPAVIITGGMIGFGALANDTGFSMAEAVATSVFVWGLPGQLAMVDLFGSGAELLAIFVAVAMANMRFFPMAVALLPTLGTRTGGLIGRAFQAHLMSANSWAFIMREGAPRQSEARLGFHTGFALLALTVGAAATAIGYAAAAGLPRPLGLTLLFLNACFLVILLIDLRERGAVAAVLAGVAVGIPANVWMPDFGLILTGLVGGTVGFLARTRPRPVGKGDA